MIVRLGAAPRRAGRTTSAFLEHWRTGHAEVAGRLPGLQAYVQYHPLLDDGVHARGYPGFDACSELDFPSLEAMDAAFSSEVYRREVSADEAELVDKRRFSLVLAEREVLAGERGDGSGVRLLTFLRRHPAVDAGELWAALVGERAERVADAVIGHELLRPVAHERGDRQRQPYDAVEELVFPSEQAARSWLASEASVQAALPLAGLTAGTTELLARGIVVV